MLFILQGIRGIRCRWGFLHVSTTHWMTERDQKSYFFTLIWFFIFCRLTASVVCCTGEIPNTNVVNTKAHPGSLPNVQLKLNNQKLWQEFHAETTEMIITKAGRWVYVGLFSNFFSYFLNVLEWNSVRMRVTFHMCRVNSFSKVEE